MNIYQGIVNKKYIWIALFIILSNPLSVMAFASIDTSLQKYLHNSHNQYQSGIYQFSVLKKYLFNPSLRKYNCTIYLGERKTECDSVDLLINIDGRRTYSYQSGYLYDVNHEKKNVRVEQSQWANVIKQFDLDRLLRVDRKCMNIDRNTIDSVVDTKVLHNSDTVIYVITRKYKMLSDVLQTSESYYHFLKTDSTLVSFSNYIYALNDTQIFKYQLSTKNNLMGDREIAQQIQDTIEYVLANYISYEKTSSVASDIDTIALSAFTNELLDRTIGTNSSSKITLVEYWYSTCLPCLQSMSVLQRIVNEYSGKVTVVGMNHIDADSAHAKRISQRQGVNYPTLFIHDNSKITELLNRYPTLLIYNSERKLQKLIVGYSSRLYDDIVSCIK